MDIIPNILGEIEFLYLDADGYGDLRNVLNTTIAKYIKRYIDNPNADETVANKVRAMLGKDIVGLTMRETLQEKGILDLVTAISPITVLTLVEEQPDILDKLEYLEENSQNMRVTIKPAKSDDYAHFRSDVARTIDAIKRDGKQPTYPDIIKRLDANKQAFYHPNGKAQGTGIGIINAKHQQWTMCLKGLRFKKYCDEKNLNYIQRRAF